jgi:hypothetical protein
MLNNHCHRVTAQLQLNKYYYYYYLVRGMRLHVHGHTCPCTAVPAALLTSHAQPVTVNHGGATGQGILPFVILLMTKAALKPYSPVGGYELPSYSEQN